MTNGRGPVSRAWRGIVAASATAVLAIGVGSAVRADDVSNDIDASIDAAAEVLALNVGGTPGATSLAITPRGSDGKSGCNLTGGTTLTVSVSSSNTAVATVSPGSVTFASCGDVKTLSVMPVGTGSTTVSLGQLSNTTGGTFNLATATFTVNVAPPANTAPTVDVTGVGSGASYEFGAVPVAGCSVNDTEDGASSFAASLSAISGPLAAFGLGTQEASCTYTDAGGSTASSSVTYSIVDTGAPTVTLQSRTAANGNGWNNTDVTVMWSCSDPVSGVVAATVSATVTGEGADQSATGTCTDGAGNSATATETNIDIDTTPPSITWVGGPADGTTHVFGSLPAAPSCSASDALSGVSGECHVTGYDATVGVHTLTAAATDAAGNTHEETRSYTVQAWTLRGFVQPVDMNGVWNTVKGGSTVPLKFEVFAGTTELTDPRVAAFSVATVACSTGSGTDEIELTTTGGTSLRFDSTSGQFIQNWQTPKQVGACYRVTMRTTDGSTLSALVKLK